MRDNKLISMTEFVNVSEKTRTEDEYFKEGFYSDCNARMLSLIYKYANFLNTPLNLSMFVPCVKIGDEWEVLEEPNDEDDKYGDSEDDFLKFESDVKQYLKAKENVLFENVESAQSLGGELFTVEMTDKYMLLFDGTETIEFLEDENITLTKNGLKQAI